MQRMTLLSKLYSSHSVFFKYVTPDSEMGCDERSSKLLLILS